MTDWLRRAGRGGLADGRVVAWTVADGERGRRWRWTVTADGTLAAAGLVERLPDGEFARLELATAVGLLTFHPADDGRTAHGNLVAGGGVRPIAVPWRAAWTIGLEDDPFGSAAAGWQGAGLVIRGDLTWRLPEEGANIRALPCDTRGMPVLLEADEWPLEE